MATPGDGPDKEELARLFSATAADHDSFGTPLFAHFGERLVDLMDLRPGHRVLDVAAGAGATLIPAARRVGETGHLTGIDIAPGMVERLAERVEEEGLTNADVAVADGEALPFDEASFDAVICSFGLFFFADPSLALRGFRRVLRDGGVLGVSTFTSAGEASIDRTWEIISAFKAIPVRADPGRRFDDAAVLTEILSDAGFDEIEVHASPLEVVFDDIDAWWAWLGSMEFRDVLEGMDEGTMAGIKSSAAAELARGPGSPRIGFPMDALLTRCRRP